MKFENPPLEICPTLWCGMGYDDKEKRASILTIQSPDGDQQTVKLRANEATVFGRSQGDIIINDNEISGTHCQIKFSSNSHHVLDMNSTNGTFVNNERIIKCRLRHNDVISIGKSSICFQIINLDDLKAEEDDSEGQQPEPGSSFKINAVYHDGSGESLTFPDAEVYIGRDIQIGKFHLDDQISRKHARIFLDHGNIHIEDLGSTNGIYINSRKIDKSEPVEATDIVVIGNTYVQISLI